MIKDAIISECGKYRYRLTRRWEPDGKVVNFIMLNPSKADAIKGDPTITRCINFAKSWGYSALVVTNLFAWRATKPKDLKPLTLSAAIGPENDHYISNNAVLAHQVVFAWGANPTRGRSQQVMEIIRKLGITPKVIRLTSKGAPEHPLRLPADCQLVEL